MAVAVAVAGVVAVAEVVDVAVAATSAVEMVRMVTFPRGVLAGRRDHQRLRFRCRSRRRRPHGNHVRHLGNEVQAQEKAQAQAQQAQPQPQCRRGTLRQAHVRDSIFWRRLGAG